MKLILNARTLIVMTVMFVLTIQVEAVEVALVPFSSATPDQAPAPWRVAGVPGGKIPLTNFSVVVLEGRKVLSVLPARSYQPYPPWGLPRHVHAANTQLRQHPR